jgi:hypothetical protein
VSGPHVSSIGANSLRRYGGKQSYPIPVWNGIFDHRKKIGPAVWVFLWCLDRITKEEGGLGLVLGGSVISAEKIANDLQECDRTIRRHLKRLEEHMYINLRRTPYGFLITVTNSKKFNIWRSDKSVQPARTQVLMRSQTAAQQTDKSVRTNKEDSAVDSALKKNPLSLQCNTCNGEQLIHQSANIPGPRLVPCPDCTKVCRATG